MIEPEFLRFLLDSALKSALLAGQNIMKIYESDNNYNVNLKSDNTVIIEADRVSHETIRKNLAKTRIPLMSEEGRNILFEERYVWDLYWLVDPIDGTLEFVHKNNEFSICIALMADNKPVIGVIVAPAFNQLYFAVEGKGSHRIDNIDFSETANYDIDEMLKGAVNIECLKEEPKEELKILTAISRSSENTESLILSLQKRYSKIDRRGCGSALKFCRMAEGAAHLYFRSTKLQDWDTAAGELIAKESGLKVKTLAGTDLTYNQQELIIDAFKVSYHNILD